MNVCNLWHDFCHCSLAAIASKLGTVVSGDLRLTMWTAIALIAIAGIIGEAYRHHAKDKLSKADHQSIDALNRRLDTLESDLKQRVETLERIVTDRSEDLKRKFDHLDKAG